MTPATTQPFVSSVELVRERVPDFSDYPFCIPALRNLTTLEMNPRVTFFRSEDTAGGWIEAQYARNDRVWVTADSMSMIFEALTAGCRVGILPVKWKRSNNKFQKSLNYLFENNRVIPYQSWLEGQGLIAQAPPLDEASRCAKEILRRWWPDRLK